MPPPMPWGWTLSVEVQALLSGRWFDGTCSEGEDVLIGLVQSPDGPRLRLHRQQGTSALADVALRDTEWPEAWARQPAALVVNLPAGGCLQIDNGLQWQRALAAAGGRAPLSRRLQERCGLMLVALVLAAAVLASLYRWMVPWAAAQLALAVPLSWETAVAAEALHALDRQLLRPTRLALPRQAQLRRDFEALVARHAPLTARAGYAPALRLEFRSGLGANAFALPGGTIVVTDALVDAAGGLAQPDAALLGVLAHEVGHVMHRHGTRLMIEQGLLQLILGAALGDLSGIASTGSALLAGLSLRRGHEDEADCFALGLLRRAGLPSQPMAQLLRQLDPGSSARDPHPPARGAFEGLLATHPETGARAERIGHGALPRCE